MDAGVAFQAAEPPGEDGSYLREQAPVLVWSPSAKPGEGRALPVCTGLGSMTVLSGIYDLTPVCRSKAVRWKGYGMEAKEQGNIFWLN